ncbi:(acyl-carrier-protein) S-malonyltransferase [Frankia torreyi]|uniref:[acyl-carrier-protein] S-malonyltransferase n=1 Tax=Frankia torreyi TaxID=1856 RepID=A0A0D8BB20_9ACTN|nr:MULTISPECIES: ACP S-malonyltransferase [Frankia]KJE21280.1 (acyl-carrier-protein) S-malonyltransferase [Frankia torreyi]KQM03333.1 (acyl-carrier-protein) S-malonyltransferase [Frankia sp. CpI1-P]
MDDLDRTGTAMVFPGMSPSRFADVARFMLLNPYARRLVAAADERLGYSLVDRFEETDGDYSEYAQVAFFVNCLALAQWAEAELGVVPDVCTGPSFGEKPATVRVGSLSFDDGVSMTARLARCLQEYFAVEHRDVVTQSFVRVPEERVREMLDDLTTRGGWNDISCHIDHDFFMVSLRERDLEWLQRAVRALGGLPLYTMRPPMHSAAFGGLRRKAGAEILADVDFADPTLPLVADQDGSVVGDAEGVRTMLLDSFVRPLRWPDVVAGLRRLGVGTVCVAGPDSLFGRVGCTTSNFEVIAVNPMLALQPRRGADPPAASTGR